VSKSIYSPLVHFSKSVLPRLWRKSKIALFTAYFDESGTDQFSYYTGVGGLLSSAEKWGQFENRWRAVLREHNIPYSHMAEYAHSTGPFKKWKSEDKKFEPERQEFLGKLCEAATDFSEYSFGFVVSKNLYEACVPEIMRREMGSPYTFLARWCLASVGVWGTDCRHDQPINVIFERGQPEHLIRHQHNILLANESARKRFRIGALSFMDKIDKDDPQRAVVQLQGADLVAYELVKNESDRRSKPVFRMRHPLKRLRNIPHIWNILTAVDLIREVAAWKKIRDYSISRGVRLMP